MRNSGEKFQKAFARKHVILAVIHIANEAQVLHNAEIAFNAGCDGIFLINHDSPFLFLHKMVRSVRSEYPHQWIGINGLDVPPIYILDHDVMKENVSGIWTDNAFCDNPHLDKLVAKSFTDKATATNWSGLYFGGVAFKYQPPVSDFGRAAKTSMSYVDVITTSGSATGKPANLEKIITMRKAVGEFPLAIASGITPDNVSEYLPFADAFLVATGISKSFTEFDPTLTKNLVDKINSYERRIV